MIRAASRDIPRREADQRKEPFRLMQDKRLFSPRFIKRCYAASVIFQRPFKRKAANCPEFRLSIAANHGVRQLLLRIYQTRGTAVAPAIEKLLLAQHTYNFAVVWATAALDTDSAKVDIFNLEVK